MSSFVKCDICGSDGIHVSNGLHPVCDGKKNCKGRILLAPLEPGKKYTRHLCKDNFSWFVIVDKSAKKFACSTCDLEYVVGCLAEYRCNQKIYRATLPTPWEVQLNNANTKKESAEQEIAKLRQELEDLKNEKKAAMTPSTIHKLEELKVKNIPSMEETSRNVANAISTAQPVKCDKCHAMYSIRLQDWHTRCTTPSCSNRLVLANLNEGFRYVEMPCGHNNGYAVVQKSLDSITCSTCFREIIIFDVATRQAYGQTTFRGYSMYNLFKVMSGNIMSDGRSAAEHAVEYMDMKKTNEKMGNQMVQMEEQNKKLSGLINAMKKVNVMLMKKIKLLTEKK